jgi:hypothetical protein
MGGWCKERYNKDKNNKLEGLHQKPDQMEETGWEGQNFSEVVALQEEEKEKEEEEKKKKKKKKKKKLWSPPLRLQASHCSTFRIMCDDPITAVFCSESIECFPGTASKFFLKLLVTIPVAPIITGIIVHLRFHIRCISVISTLIVL